MAHAKLTTPNDGLQLLRAISIQADGKKLLEKHAIAPSAARLCYARRSRLGCDPFDYHHHYHKEPEQQTSAADEEAPPYFAHPFEFAT